MERVFKCRGCGHLYNSIVSSCDCNNENYPKGGSKFCYDEYVCLPVTKNSKVVPVDALDIMPGHWQNSGEMITTEIRGAMGFFAQVNQVGENLSDEEVETFQNTVRVMAGSKLMLETLYAVRAHLKAQLNRVKSSQTRDMVEIIDTAIANAITK